MKGESNIKIDNINNPYIHDKFGIGCRKKNKLEKSLVELRKRVSNIEKSVMSIPSSASSALSDAKKAKKRSILSRSKKK